MTLHRSEIAKGSRSQPYPFEAGSVCSVRSSITVPADAEAGDIFEMAALPSGCRLVDAILDSDDIDTHGTPTATYDVGIMSGEFGADDVARTCGDEIIDGATIAQTGGVARPTLASAVRISTSTSDRGIGIKLATAAATGAAGEVGLTLLYAPA